MIQINHLSKSYQGKKVLDIEQLSIPSGESFGLVGNNGAGKTTLFSLLLDLIQPDQGRIDNHSVTVFSSEKWKTFTSAFIDDSFIIDYLTAEEYFEFIGSLRGIASKDIRSQLEGFSSFFNGEVWDQKKYLRDFSKGNQKKVGLAAAFLGQPKLIVLDEPFANLDPSSQFKLKAFLGEMAKEKEATLLISSHDLNHVTEVCSRIVLLDKGEIKRDLQTHSSTLKELEAYFSGEDTY